MIKKGKFVKISRTLVVMLWISALCIQAFSQQINVCIKIRGKTGLEEKVKNFIIKEFNSFDLVRVTENRDECHLYLDFSLVEQEPIRFYGLGVCIAYHFHDAYYSRPTSDVAQFGEERMEDVCRYLAREIDRTFVKSLRHPPDKSASS